MIAGLLLYQLCFVFLPLLWLLPWIWRQTSDFSLTSVLSLALGPLLGASTLFLFLVLFPGSGPKFYLSAWLTINLLVIGAFFSKGFQVLGIYKRYWHALIGRIGLKTVCLSLLALFILPPTYASLRDISEHDTFEYITLGKSLYENGEIHFPGFRYLPNGFFYVAMHGFIYPLLFTIQSFFTPNQDFIFKTIPLFYALLLIFLFALRIRRLPKPWWIPSMLLLLSAYGFIFSILQFHLEAIRLFLIFASVLLAWHYLRLHRNCVLLLGVVLGLQAGLHFIGLIASLIIMAGIFLFNPLSLPEKTWATVRMFFLFILLGAVHYILEWIADPFWWLQILQR